MQAAVPFGSSAISAASASASRSWHPAPATRTKRARQWELQTSHKKPFLCGEFPASRLGFPARIDSGRCFPLGQSRCDPPTKAFARFFVDGRDWEHKDPPASSKSAQSGVNGANGALINRPSWVEGKGQSLLLRSAWIAAMVLMGGGGLYGQAKAQSYVERNVLPPVTAAAEQYFGREVHLGKVRRLTPLGVTLGPCSVGPHDEEFSCAEIPGVEIRILPLASLRKRKLVVDAVLAQPHVLVSQKEDWTWLGIPMLSETGGRTRRSSEPNIDARTKVRRLSREETGHRLTNQRKRAAWDAARRGYKLPGADSSRPRAGHQARERFQGREREEVDDSDHEEGIDTTSSYLGADEVDGTKAGQQVEERLAEGDEANSGFELWNYMVGGKVWLDHNMMRPVKRRLLRRWTRQELTDPLSKSLQRRNLERSAAAARLFFQKLDKSQSSGNEGREAPGGKNDESPVRSMGKHKGSRLEETRKRGSGSGRGKAARLGSGVDAGGVSVHPFSHTSRSSLPSASISSSWVARDHAQEVRREWPLPSFTDVRGEDRPQGTRESGRSIFRNLGRTGLRSFVSKTAGGRRKGTLEKNSTDMLTEKEARADKQNVVDMDCDTTSQFSPMEEESSRSSIESVKDALVQAIRSQQSLRSKNTEGSSSSQQQFNQNVRSVKRNFSDSKMLHMRNCEGFTEAQRHLAPQIDREETSVQNYTLFNATRSASSLPSLPDILCEKKVGRHTQELQTSALPNFTKIINGVCESLVSALPKDRIDHTPDQSRPSQEDINPTSSGNSGSNSQVFRDDFDDENEDQRMSKTAEKSMEGRLMSQAKAKRETATAWTPVALNSVYFKGGSLMLLAFGDHEPRVVEKATGHVKLSNDYQQINVRVTGSPKEFRVGNGQGDGGRIFVKVAVNLAKQEWHLRVRGRNLFAPLFEKLFELPLDWSSGRANGEVHAWMMKDDLFPSFGGRVDVRGIDFAVWDAPAAFKGVSGTLFFQGQRLFFHNASGLYGAIPLQVSGDMDLTPDDGEYRLSSQVSGVEANALMKTLKAPPPPFPLAGALKAVVHCRGPLDAPIFEGSAELSGKHMALVFDAPGSSAIRAIKSDEQTGAIAAYDRVPFASASASFTFNTDDCMAELYGMRATPVGGGEIRGAGSLWLCPEGDLDPSAVNVDCAGQVATNPILRSYIPAGMDTSSVSFGTMHGKAKISGALLMPVFDIKWNTPEAQGPFDGAHGDVHISRSAISINSSGFAYDLSTKIHTLYPPISTSAIRKYEFKPHVPPIVEGLDLDAKLRGFDFVAIAPVKSSFLDLSHMQVTGEVKFHGTVPKPITDDAFVHDQPVLANEDEKVEPPSAKSSRELSGLVGDLSLSRLKLNQLLVAPQLTGSLEVSPSGFKVHATGRADEHLHVLVSKRSDSSSQSPAPDLFFEQVGEGISFSLLRGQLRTDFHHQPGQSTRIEIRNLQLDELELASLRGAVQKADLALNFQKRRGQGSLYVRQPRGSGIQGESLDISARWSGDVISLDKSVLAQAHSKYELQGEYVLPSLRDRSVADKGKDEGMWEKVMAGQLGHMITSMGRWRLRLDVPNAEVSDMLPVARLLARSSDPEVVSRSKELFLQGVQRAGFAAENLKEQLENIRKSHGITTPDGSPESFPRPPESFPGLAELKGAWRGTLEASGGGDGDTNADFDLRGDEWEWGSYKTKKVLAIGDYSNNDGLRFQKFFIQKDTATLHADGTLLGPKPNLHFAVLNFPVGLVPPLLHAIKSSTPAPFLTPTSPYSTPIKGILYMEGDLRGHSAKPQCDVQIRLLDGSIGGVSVGKAEMAASLTSANRLAFNAVVEPVAQTGHVRIQGSLPMGPKGLEEVETEVPGAERAKPTRTSSWGRERSRDRKDEEEDETDEGLDKGVEEGWEVRLAESLKAIDGEFLDSGAVQVDAAVKDGGMMLLTAISPGFHWIQGLADIQLQLRGTVQQPSADGTASFTRVSISSPVLQRPLSNMGGTITIRNNQLIVEGLEGRVGRRGLVQVKGQLPLRKSDTLTVADSIEVKAESLEVRAKHAFSGQVNSNIRLMGSLLEPEVTGMIKLSHGDAYLSQERSTASLPATISSSPPGGGYSWRAAASSAGRRDVTVFPVPGQLGDKPGSKDRSLQPPIDIRLRSLKLILGPELRMVYPLILNFGVSGDLDLNGFADALRVKPRGTLTFENGDVNLVATQVRLNKDHLNRAKFEPEQGLDPTLDLALIGADWQLKVQGRARHWQDNIVVSSTRTGEQDDALARDEATRVFESQLADSLLEGDGQLAFKKLAAATVETLMPRIETKGEFGQARWRLVSAPQIPNLLSLDPTTAPFMSLSNLSFGAEVEVQLGKRLQASMARRLKETEMATEWTLLYQLNSKLRLLFSSIPSVDNRLLFEYSATSQN